MPVISRPLHQGRAEVDVELNVPLLFAQHLQAAGQPVPNFQQATGLLDIGASMTCIDSSLIQALHLLPHGSQQVRTPTTGANPVTSSTYLLDLTVLHPSGDHKRDLVVSDLEVVEAHFINMGHLVLIGTDVLALCRLAYDGRASRFRLRY
jgi:hypothetical protein